MKKTLILLTSTFLLAGCGAHKKPVSEHERLQQLGYQSDITSSTGVNH